MHQPSREYQIYAHVYDSSGRALGADFKVSRHPAGAVMPVEPAVAIKPNNQFFVCWSYGDPADIHGHLYDADNSTIRDDWVLSSLGDFVPVGPNFRPKVCSTPLGYAVVWDSHRGRDSDIFLKNFGPTGTQLGSFVVLNERPGNQTSGDVAVSPRALLICAWQDDRNDNFDIYGNWACLQIPDNVVAGSGFNGRVPLTWDHLYGNERISRYKIWRSIGVGAPLSQIATVDLSLRGAAGYSLRDYIDFTAVNGQSYLYRIEADVPESGGLSLWVTATPADSGHTLRSQWATQTPTIDGIISENEWQDATRINISTAFTPQPVHL